MFVQMREKHTTSVCVYNTVFLMMNIRCSKHVQDKKNLIKTLIQICILSVNIT
jgi:hypothetical protein